MTPAPRRIPDALLERYLADALDAAEKARLEASVADSPQDRARLEELRADSAAFLVQHPPGPLVARFQEAPRRARWWRWPSLILPVLAAGAAVLLLLLPIEPPYTTKGSVVLVLHRRTEEGSAPVSPEVPLVPGDALRFEVKVPERGFVAVIGRDARGTVTVYHPYGGTSAAPHEAHPPLLPGAIALDDTLGREDVYALYSTRPFELGWAVRALETGRALQEEAPREVAVGHTFFTKQAAR